MTTIPFHYRHNGQPCDSSGAEGWVEGQTCPRGCDGARYHYANDGHPECDENGDPLTADEWQLAQAALRLKGD